MKQLLEEGRLSRGRQLRCSGGRLLSASLKIEKFYFLG